ncbi:hypothetical protein [Gilliamella sp. App6-5]|uniref:hypothetical protein n=1 Tax=Gilliamella sp. App6-5 TaxID=3120232 RepID=UPI00159EC9A5|nr:hypothetical protein [Gilliamella apicola]
MKIHKTTKLTSYHKQEIWRLYHKEEITITDLAKCYTVIHKNNQAIGVTML